MIERFSSTMSKVALIILFLFLVIATPTGKSAQVCPKNPLAPNNSISGLVIGSIVATEKLTAGVLSYCYFLVANTINQGITLVGKTEQFLMKDSMKIHNFIMGIISGSSNQLKKVYAASGGTVKSILDILIKIENSVQTMVFGQIKGLTNNISSGKLEQKVIALISDPIHSIKSGVGRLTIYLDAEMKKIRAGINGIIGKFKNGTYSFEFGGILTAPIDATKYFLHSSIMAVKNVSADSSERFSGFMTVLGHGSLTEIVSAIIASPVGVIEEIWSCTIKITAAFKSSIGLGLKNMVQPLLGTGLTHFFGKTISFPFDIIVGLWNSYKGILNELKAVSAQVTGGGSLSVQINTVINHPIETLSNIWKVTISEIKGFGKATIGVELTDELMKVLSSPAKILSSFLSPILGKGSLKAQLQTFVGSPITLTRSIWISTKEGIAGLARVLLGDTLTRKLGQLMSLPFTITNEFLSVFTGEGSLSFKLITTLKNPLLMINTIYMRTKSLIGNYITFVTGGGGLKTQIITVFGSPIETLKRTFAATKGTISNSIKTIFGGNFTKSVGGIITSPLSSLKYIFVSITGDGKLKTLLSNPETVVKNLYNTTIIYTKGISYKILGKTITNDLGHLIGAPLSLLTGSLSFVVDGSKDLIIHPMYTIKVLWFKATGLLKDSLRAVFGGRFTGEISHVFTSPLSTLSNLIGSITASLKKLLGGNVQASGSISVGGSQAAGGRTGLTGAVTSAIKAPGKVAKKSFDELAKIWKSFSHLVQGGLSKIPLVGKGSFKSKVSFGGGAGAGSSGNLHSSISFGGSKKSSGGGSLLLNSKGSSGRRGSIHESHEGGAGSYGGGARASASIRV